MLLSIDPSSFKRQEWLIDKSMIVVIQLIWWGESVESVQYFNFLLKLPSIGIEPALYLFMIGWSLDFRHDHFLKTEVIHPLFETYHFSIGLYYGICTKLNISSSSEHLLLPIPKFFQQLVSALKY